LNDFSLVIFAMQRICCPGMKIIVNDANIFIYLIEPIREQTKEGD